MKLDLDYRDFQPANWPGVTVRIRPLETPAFQRLLKYVNLSQDADGKMALGRSTVEFMNDNELLIVAKEIIPTHVESVSGLEIRAHGKTNDAGIDDVLKYAHTLPLVIEIIAQLLRISLLTETDVKN